MEASEEPPRQLRGASSSEAYYRAHLDALAKENKALKARLEVAERENAALKRSVFELSTGLHHPHGASALPLPASAPVPLAAPLSDPQAPAPSSAGSAPERLAASAEAGHDRGGAGAASSGSAGGAGGWFVEKGEWPGPGGAGGQRALYAVRFAPGSAGAARALLAFGGLDKCVRVWDAQKGHAEGAVLAAGSHAGPVVDVAWAPDAAELASAGLDGRVRLWDVAKARLLGAWELTALPAALAFHPSDANLFAAVGAERGALTLFDRRSPVPARRLHDGDAPVGGVALGRAGEAVSGDADGVLRMWELRREAGPVRRWSVGGPLPALAEAESASSRRAGGGGSLAISCVGLGRSADEADDRGYVLAGAYDNVLRVFAYARLEASGLGPADPPGSGSAAGAGAAPAPSSASAPAPGAPQPSPAPAPGPAGPGRGSGGCQLLHSLGGHKNRNWPIRSSLFWGKDYRARPEQASLEEGEDGGPPSQQRSMHERWLAASGSADGSAFVWDLGARGPGSAAGAQPPAQRLAAHAERCYAAAFHPSEPLLATCGADGRVKLFGLGPEARGAGGAPDSRGPAPG